MNLSNTKKVIAIHQPECLPWIGFFNKMMLADEYIFLDDVQYCKRNFQNRNQIVFNGSKLYLTLPVNCSLSSIIKDVKISNSSYIQKHLKTLQRAYCKEDFYHSFFPLLEKVYTTNHQFLIDFNLSFISLVRKYLQIDTPLQLSSKFQINSTKTQRIIDLIQSLSGRQYITGEVSLNYLNPTEFTKESISLFIHSTNPIYKNKRNENFTSHLSVIDLLMQYSSCEAKSIILQSGTTIAYSSFIADR